MQDGVYREVKIIEDKKPSGWFWYQKTIFVTTDEKSQSTIGFWFGDDNIGYGEILLTNKLGAEVTSDDNRAIIDSAANYEKAIEQGRYIVFENMNFKTSSYEIDSASRGQIEKLLPTIEKKQCRIAIIGHTDKTGSTKGNILLSEKRARSVKALLASNGVAPESIETYGMGSSLPVDNNETKEAHAKNRRVEIKIIRE